MDNFKIDVLLINPPFSRLKGVPNPVYFHLNIGYLAAALRKICTVKIYNAEDPLFIAAEEYNRDIQDIKKQYFNMFNSSKRYKWALESDNHPVWEEIRQVLMKYRPKIIGISCMSAKYPSALKVAHIYKECIPEGFVIFGGQHPTIRTKDVLMSEIVDFAVRGEADESVVEIVSALLKCRPSTDDIAKIKGVSFRSGDSIIHTENRIPLDKLDNLDFPARELLVKPLNDKTAYGAIITSRGCAFDCAFCSAKAVVGRKVRYRSIQNVTDEIKDVRDTYKIRNFFFWDDTFTINRERTIELCRAIQKLHIDWACTTRVDRVDYSLLKEMKRAGCVSIDYGIESGSERMLAVINKNITKASIEKALFESVKAGIIPNVFLMVGFPDETENDILETIAFAKSTKAFSICLSIFTPYPATPLFERACELDLIRNNFDWSNFSHQSFANFFSQCIPPDRFHALLGELISTIDKHNASLYKKMLQATIIARTNPGLAVKKILRKLKVKIT
jgi:anaerobic magnesium-protoporphyrin IX monomethyl ester cyclase